MISWMQKHRKYLVVTIWISTIAFVGAGFVGWGAYSLTGGNSNTLAKVGNRSISNSDLQSAYSNIYRFYNQMLGGRLTQEKAQQLHLQDIALNQLINQNLLLNYADDKGITALKEEVAQKIAQNKNFQKDGTFDKQRYFQVLKAINKEPKEFENDIKKEIILDKLNKALHLPSTNLEIQTIASLKYMADKIKTKVIEVKDSDINITDSQLKEYWKKHKNSYKSKESYKVEVVKVKYDTIKVDPKQLENYYHEHKTLFKDKDDKILSFEDAKDRVLKMVQKKEAKKASLKKYIDFKNGKIKADKTETLTIDQKNVPVEKIAQSKIGSYIKAVELDDGYATYKLVEINNPKPLSFDDAKEIARKELLKVKKMKLLEKNAKNSLKNMKDAKKTSFLTIEDSDKLEGIDKKDAKRFLSYLFNKNDKEGYFIFDNKAILYKIIDQKLVLADKLKNSEKEISKDVVSIKNKIINNSLIKELKKKYKIEKYYKG